MKRSGFWFPASVSNVPQRCWFVSAIALVAAIVLWTPASSWAASDDGDVVYVESNFIGGNSILAFRNDGTPLQAVLARDQYSVELRAVPGARTLQTFTAPNPHAPVIVASALTPDGSHVAASMREHMAALNLAALTSFSRHCGTM